MTDQPDTPPLALISGASSGVGAACVRALAGTHRLVLLGRDAEALERVREAAGRDARVVIADLADPVATETALRAGAPDALERLDAVVHSAGVISLGRTDTAPLADWRDAYEVNVLAVVSLTTLLLPALRAARGHVVAVNSGAGFTAKAEWGAYAASKFALRAYTDVLRQEEPGIRVTSVHPGRIDTPMQRRVVAYEGGDYEPRRFLTAESVARAIVSALEATPDAHPTEVTLRPGNLKDWSA